MERAPYPVDKDVIGLYTLGRKLVPITLLTCRQLDQAVGQKPF